MHCRKCVFNQKWPMFFVCDIDLFSDTLVLVCDIYPARTIWHCMFLINRSALVNYWGS